MAMDAPIDTDKVCAAGGCVCGDSPVGGISICSSGKDVLDANKVSEQRKKEEREEVLIGAEGALLAVIKYAHNCLLTYLKPVLIF